MVTETQEDKAYVGIKALWHPETWIDSMSFDDFPTIDPTGMAVLRAHVNEVRDPTTMKAWIKHDRLRKHRRLSVAAIKDADQAPRCSGPYEVPRLPETGNKGLPAHAAWHHVHRVGSDRREAEEAIAEREHTEDNRNEKGRQRMVWPGG
jgi:hypothetical protein